MKKLFGEKLGTTFIKARNLSLKLIPFVIVSIILLPLIDKIPHLREVEDRYKIKYSRSLIKDLHGCNLSGEDLSNLRMKKYNMKNADLSRSYLQEASFQSADLTSANLRSAYINHSDFSFACLRGTTMWRARVFNSNFGYANLQDADLRYGVIMNSNFKSANLTSINLQGVYYDKLTIWPDHFDPTKYGAKLWVNEAH